MDTAQLPAMPWDTLCRNIVTKNVIPVIGNEMYSCLVNGEPSSAEEWFAQKLQENFRTNEPSVKTLTGAAEYLVNDQHTKIKSVRIFLQTLSADNLVFPILEEFASVDQLLFYINTTPYGYILKRTIDKVRDTESAEDNFTIDESFKGCNISDLTSPFVLNTVGSLKKSLSPALLEEEILESVNTFIEKKLNGPFPNILGALSSKTLLFLGCSHPSWLMRFLLRNISNERIASWDDRGGDIIVVNDRSAERDVKFDFLRKNNAITYEGNTADFVKELSTNWQNYIRLNPPKPKEIFLSYSHKDLDQARRMFQALSAIKNVKCWFDEQRLQAGNNYQVGITAGISTADLFIPLLSNNSLDSNADVLVNVKGEWRQAIYTNDLKKQKSGGKEVNYLMPVLIDNVNKADPIIQDFFPKIVIADVQGGNAGETFISQVKQQLGII